MIQIERLKTRLLGKVDGLCGLVEGLTEESHVRDYEEAVETLDELIAEVQAATRAGAK